MAIPAIGAVALIASAITSRGDGRTTFLVSGGLLSVVGSLGVTAALNLPHNGTLAAVVPTSGAAAPVWRDYLTDWTHWNQVRSTASLLASAAFTLALR